jgi:hypothetical protein
MESKIIGFRTIKMIKNTLIEKNFIFILIFNYKI